MFNVAQVIEIEENEIAPESEHQLDSGIKMARVGHEKTILES